MFSGFDEAFGTFDTKFGQTTVIADFAVVRGCIDFGSLDVALEFGDFFRSFVNQKDH